MRKAHIKLNYKQQNDMAEILRREANEWLELGEISLHKLERAILEIWLWLWRFSFLFSEMKVDNCENCPFYQMYYDADRDQYFYRCSQAKKIITTEMEIPDWCPFLEEVNDEKQKRE